MNAENPQLVTDEIIEFEKWPVEVQDFRKITNNWEEFREYNSNWKRKTEWMSTCNRLDLETLGSRPIMSKSLPGHWHIVWTSKVLWIFNCPYRLTICMETISTNYRGIKTLTTWSWGLPIAGCWPCHPELPLVTGNLAFSLSASNRCNQVNARWDVLSTYWKL